MGRTDNSGIARNEYEAITPPTDPIIRIDQMAGIGARCALRLQATACALINSGDGSK